MGADHPDVYNGARRCEDAAAALYVPVSRHLRHRTVGPPLKCHRFSLRVELNGADIIEMASRLIMLRYLFLFFSFLREVTACCYGRAKRRPLVTPSLVRHTFWFVQIRAYLKSHISVFFSFPDGIEFDPAAEFDLGSFCSCIARRSHYGSM